MPAERLNIATGEKVMAYDREEAYNLAARMVGVSFSERGIFALGVLAGMFVADKKFKRPPQSEGVNPDYGYASVAMAMAELREHYIDMKRRACTEETERGPEWVDKKLALVEKMIFDGDALNADLDKHLERIEKQKVEEADKELAGQVKKEETDGEEG